MPQEFQVLKCISCSAFQVQLSKKSGKWSCVKCGTKQTLMKVYAVSNNAKDCRAVCVSLSTAQGEAQEQQADSLFLRANDDDYGAAAGHAGSAAAAAGFAAARHPPAALQVPARSKAAVNWGEYVAEDEQEGVPDEACQGGPFVTEVAGSGGGGRGQGTRRTAAAAPAGAGQPPAKQRRAHYEGEHGGSGRQAYAAGSAAAPGSFGASVGARQGAAARPMQPQQGTFGTQQQQQVVGPWGGMVHGQGVHEVQQQQQQQQEAAGPWQQGAPEGPGVRRQQQQQQQQHTQHTQHPRPMQQQQQQQQPSQQGQHTTHRQPWQQQQQQFRDHSAQGGRQPQQWPLSARQQHQPTRPMMFPAAGQQGFGQGRQGVTVPAPTKVAGAKWGSYVDEEEPEPEASGDGMYCT